MTGGPRTSPRRPARQMWSFRSHCTNSSASREQLSKGLRSTGFVQTEELVPFGNRRKPPYDAVFYLVAQAESEPMKAPRKQVAVLHDTIDDQSLAVRIGHVRNAG